MQRVKRSETSQSSYGYSNDAYSVTYSAGSGARAPSLVKTVSLRELHSRYSGILWEEGSHKQNVSAFIAEIDQILGEPFSTITQEAVDDVVGVLRGRGNSNATINRKMAALSKLLRKAQKMGDLHSLPEFRRQKERAGRIRFLAQDEEERLFEAIRSRSEDYHRLSIFLVDTGARLGEAIGLRWNDVSDGRASFWITKSGRSRSVPLTRRALDAVAGGTARLGPFAGIRQHRYRIVWNEAKAEVGLGKDDDVVPHVLRHTCASRLVRGGVDIRRVQMWLGHQTLQMTMRYAHLATSDLDICLRVLEQQTDDEPGGTPSLSKRSSGQRP